MITKKIIFIPPNGEFKKQDFSLQRILKYLVSEENIETTLVYIESPTLKIDTTFYDYVIKTKTQNEVLDVVKTMEYDFVFHRSWMGAYEFAAKLLKELKDVRINIKDWNFASKEVYEFLYPDIKDYEAVEYIFKYSKKVLSHFTKEQAKIWANAYKVDEDKFYFFPEYCNEKEFNTKPNIKYENIHLVYAGAIQSTVKPEDYFPGKAHLRSVKLLTSQEIKIDFVLPQYVYDYTQKSIELYKDFLYEDKVNESFNIIKGEALNPAILNKYHFGFFELETTGLNHMLYKYAITSKFSFYLEAGLPILINEKFVSMSKIIEKYNLGIVFKNQELKNMNEKLNISQEKYDEYIKNIETYRKSFIYNSEILQELFCI